MKNTEFSRHSILDLRKWSQDGQLEIKPDFQRGAVWTDQARSMLIDSIINDVPLPKIYIATEIKNGDLFKSVIDGQQRVSAILDYIDGRYKLAPPCSEPYVDKFFKELPDDLQSKILQYRLDFNEFEDHSEEEIRNIYHRVNKYTVSLNKQELRRADFPGNFLDLSEKLSNLEFWDESRIFTPANRRRLGDVEYVSELIAIVISGIQDKKVALDDFYIKYRVWDKTDKNTVEEYFKDTINDIDAIFKDWKPISKTRFRQKSDFYAFFAAVCSLKQDGQSLDQALLKHLQNDLAMLDASIEPEAPGPLGEYAIRCVSDANSKSSRTWRMEFLKTFLVGAYDPFTEDQQRLAFFHSIRTAVDSGLCPAIEDCAICGEMVTEFKKGQKYAYPRGKVFFNTQYLIHGDCINEAFLANWLVYDGRN